MQKALFITLIFLCLLAPACTPTATEPPTALAAVSPAASTLTLSPTLAATQQSTLTPAPPILTPLPTIPTFTPTFDVRTIVTATPAPKAECPHPNSDIKFIVPAQDPVMYNTNYKELILDFLRKGGNVHEAYNKLRSNLYTRDRVYLQDVTNDGFPELIWTNNDGASGGNDIFGCNPKDSQYELLYQPHIFDPGDYYDLINIKDMNSDGVPEIIFFTSSCAGGRCGAIFITEWNGEKFVDLIRDSEFSPGDILDWAPTGDLTKFELADTDQNGTTELIWAGGVEPPWIYQVTKIKSYYREEIHAYSWNGEYFIPLPVRYAPPIYRFQSVQDADQETLVGEYDLAFSAYQDTIFSTKLDSWSEDRAGQLGARLEARYGTATPTAFPEDKTEYPRLSAYAYYRMVILHIKLGEMEAAQTHYTTLQEKFPADNPGHPYAEMATAFWNTYQTSQNMTNACGAAILYAAEHPDILTMLGSGEYHGQQSHKYVPADVCPFR